MTPEEYRKAHAAKVRREWIKNNPDKVREQVKRWRNKHREEYNAYHRDYYAKNKEKIQRRRNAKSNSNSTDDGRAVDTNLCV